MSQKICTRSGLLWDECSTEEHLQDGGCIPGQTRQKRYTLVCVAPEVPDGGSTDDLDEAFTWATANYEIYDNELRCYGPNPVCWKEVLEAKERLLVKRAIRQADMGGLFPNRLKHYSPKDLTSNHLPTRENALACLRYFAFHAPGHEQHEVLCTNGPLKGTYIVWLPDMTGYYPDVEHHLGHYVVYESHPQIAVWRDEDPFHGRTCNESATVGHVFPTQPPPPPPGGHRCQCGALVFGREGVRATTH